MKDKTFRRVFTRNGKLLTKGDLLIRPQLAKTLQLIARAGSAEPFYNGPMSKALVKEVRAAGGVLTLMNLKNYKVKFRPKKNIPLPSCWSIDQYFLIMRHLIG
ncbi:hypothetical protein OS493_000981 [Desmophyllum pertusum]|uniref:Uncharacterized protein n=1 Tax=Desmophyllum pertusum TaxID=174260 RepID=A0A9X0D5I5_9CNID|nr:hypothetical protein OS493_000981 [Desmophyllum pertusum]